MTARAVGTAAVLGSVALVLVASDIRGQEPPDTTRFTLTGSVVDASTRRALIGAIVKFPELRRLEYVQVDGTFAFEDFPEGTWQVVIEQLGYHTSETEANLVAGNEIHVNLRPDPVALAGFRVLSRSQRIIAERSRKVPYRVVTYPPELFSDAANPDPAAIFRSRPTVAIVPCNPRSTGEISTPGCFWGRGGATTKIKVYLDEGPLLGGMEELSMYLARDIHSMEWVKEMAMLRVYTHRFIARLDVSQISLEPLVYDRQ